MLYTELIGWNYSLSQEKTSLRHGNSLWDYFALIRDVKDIYKIYSIILLALESTLGIDSSKQTNFKMP